ncbi:MAG: LysM peptidoglycan-binding domain-containing protein [Nonlabens sp.]
MKKFCYILLVVLAFAKAETLTAQNYKQHTVSSGETVETIAKKYSISKDELLMLNPDLKSGVKPGASLLIPADAKVLTQKRIKEYKTHKARRKETLYSISKKYGVTILDIKDANKILYYQPLKKGDKIQIPVFYDEKDVVEEIKSPQEIQESVSKELSALGKYKVLPKEGFYRVAKKNNTTVMQIKKLNPEVDQLKPGMIINIPTEELEAEIAGTPTEQAIDVVVENIEVLDALDPKLVEFEIPYKIGMYSLKKMAGIDEDSLISLNPQLKDGLKAGMMIKIPDNKYIDTLQVYRASYKVANLADSIQSYEPQDIAIMLPLSLNSVNEEVTLKDLLKSSTTTQIAIDFLTGLRMAQDSALSLGLRVNFDYFDTAKSPSITKEILSSNDFSKYSAVIGPLLSKNVLEVAQALQSDKIPVVSPLTTTSVSSYDNLIQARPSDEILKFRLKRFLKVYAKDKNVIIVTDNTAPKLREEFSVLFPNARVLVPLEKNNYIYSVNYLKELVPSEENVIILAVENVQFITDAITNYSAKTESHNITMFGMDNYEEMDLPNTRLAALNYTFPQMHKDANEENEFVRKYYEQNEMLPNQYVTRGFDIGMDVILRQASTGNLFESLKVHGLTSMVESKFDYNKNVFKGYYNEAVFMLQYQNDLSLEEIEIAPLKKL